jgi:hypothetical protein
LKAFVISFGPRGNGIQNGKALPTKKKKESRLALNKAYLCLYQVPEQLHPIYFAFDINAVLINSL